MIGFWSLLFAAVLLLFLLLVALKGFLTARDLRVEIDMPTEDQLGVFPCPPELAARVFSRADWEFISTQKINGLRKLFQLERKSLALLWVRQTVSSIHRVMREHAEIARSSRDLETATEMKLFVQYGMLLATCGLLYAAIQVAGPFSMTRLAFYAEKLSARISEAGQHIHGVPTPGEIRIAGS